VLGFGGYVQGGARDPSRKSRNSGTFSLEQACKTSSAASDASANRRMSDASDAPDAKIRTYSKCDPPKTCPRPTGASICRLGWNCFRHLPRCPAFVVIGRPQSRPRLRLKATMPSIFCCHVPTRPNLLFSGELSWHPASCHWVPGLPRWSRQSWLISAGVSSCTWLLSRRPVKQAEMYSARC
jgi:hypothetical protein